MVLRSATPLLLCALLMAGAAVPAHAGMLNWVDEMFTFREDQKERVSPRRNIPPKVVVSPYYDERAHDGWNTYYTRQDLQPQGYIAGSASKVMRPIAPPPGTPSGQYDRGFGNSGSSTYIGDPGTGPAMVMGGADANIGGATRIGSAVRDWRDGPPATMGRRPGDYDYRLHADNGTCCAGSGGNYVYTERGDDTDSGRAAEGPYIRFNTQGDVTGYRVQRGDTLSTIADQPRIYQNWKLWPLIYDANRGSIGRDPDNIYPQQKLDIPRGYSGSEANAAEKRALRRGQSVYGDGR